MPTKLKPAAMVSVKVPTKDKDDWNDKNLSPFEYLQEKPPQIKQ